MPGASVPAGRSWQAGHGRLTRSRDGMGTIGYRVQEEIDTPRRPADIWRGPHEEVPRGNDFHFGASVGW